MGKMGKITTAKKSKKLKKSKKTKKYKAALTSAALLLLGLFSCGLPSLVEIPLAPISVDNDSETDNTLTFITPSDTKIDRYLVWYKIYPNAVRTTTNTLVDKDYDYFDDLNTRSATEIRNKDFHELYLSPSLSAGFYLFGLGNGVRVTISKDSSDEDNYIKLSIAGGSIYNVRRDMANSTTDSNRKEFYGAYDLDADDDIKSRKGSDFRDYTSVDKGFAIAFLGQSGYVNAEDLEIVTSEVTKLGVIYSTDGFENN